ncbi:Y-family DNA polymerase [Thaumasiovibrio subtropicus]|uniref:Y-family DNA polymerase n=1 Tax=Thaumasiovibrio subtropicus TaxID=1891207 RepID=UPI000B34ED16|nr:DNA polymerase Y family protein [Thaumasiovibrio subtropicus]
MTLWLYLHFPSLQLESLFAQQRGQGAPEADRLLTEAVIVVDGKRHEIVQMNSAAVAAGVKLGMGLGTAASLCPDLQVIPYEQESEARRLKEIAHWLYLVTSDMAFFPPNGLLLRVTEMLTLYDGLDNYWQHLSEHLNKLGLTYTYSTGYSPYAARLLARSGGNCVTESREWLMQRLKQHALATTELLPNTIEKLSRIGVNDLQTLLNLPMAEIARRFDIELVNYVGRLTGQFKHPIDFYHPPESFERYLELLFDIENVQWLARPLSRLLKEMAAFLKLRDLLALELAVTLHQRDLPESVVTLTSAQGEYSAEKWLALSALTLESVALDGPVMGITLKVVRVTEQRGDDVDLFAGKQGTMMPLELLSLLQAKLGENAVQGVVLTADPRPELASQVCMPLYTKSKQIHAAEALLRPSFLLPKPEPLQEKVDVMQGPERIATGWWDSHPVVRDYFVARSGEGRWLWIFRNQRQEWFVHGMFS